MLKNIFDKILGRKKHEFKRHDLINMLIDHFLYKRYLEIGVDKSANFTSIRCESKTSVDPAEGLYAHAKPTYQITSDEFFRNVAPTLEKFDIIFIDGLHHHKQVNRDIENSLKYLNENGSIVLHDCNPAKEIHQSVPRKSTLWNGDVWKSIVEFRNTNKELGCLVIDTDYGLGWIHKSIPVSKGFKYKLTYKSLKWNRKKYLNLVNPEKFNLNHIQN